MLVLSYCHQYCTRLMTARGEHRNLLLLASREMTIVDTVHAPSMTKDGSDIHRFPAVHGGY